MAAFVFKDIDLNFGIHPNTNKLVTSVDELAVRRALGYLISTGFGDRLFHPEIGCGLKQLLFENIMRSTALSIKSAIIEAVNNYEPRVSINELIVAANPDQNGYNVVMKFTIVNQSILQTIEFFLERLR